MTKFKSTACIVGISGICILAAPLATRAQSSGPSALPPVIVEQSNRPSAAREVRPRGTGRATRRAALANRQQQQAQPVVPQRNPAIQAAYSQQRNDAVNYVANAAASATKTSTSLLETPQSVSVVTQKEMTDRATKTIGEAIRYTAGVMGDFWGGLDQRYDKTLIRGFEAPTYLNGLRLVEGTFAGLARPEPYGLERIEVLKGPASVLYGQSVPGGLVNLVSKKPTEQPFGELNLAAGSFDRFQGSFDFGGPLDPKGEYLYRLTGLVRDSETQVDAGKDDRVFLAPSFTWRPTVDTNITIYGSYLREGLGNQVAVLPPTGTLRPASYGFIPTSFNPGEPSFDKFGRESGAIGYAAEHHVDDVWTVRQNFRYNSDDAYYQYVSYSGTPVVGTTMQRRRSFVDQQLQSVSVDNQAEAKFATAFVKHTVLFGIDSRHAESSFQFGTAAAQSLNILNPVYNLPVAVPPATRSEYQTQDQTGFYIQDQMRLDRWALTIGARQDQANSSTLNRFTNRTVDQNDPATTWRAGLVYLADNGLAPYASYSTSFEPVAGSDFSGNPFRPTTGRQYEVGIKYQPVGFDGYVTLATYEITQQNVTTTDPIPSHLGFNVQTGEIRVRGVEVEGVANVTKSLTLRASATYMDGRITQSNDYLGNRPAQIPRNLANIWANYRFLDGPIQGLSLGAGVRFVDDRFGDAANLMLLPKTTLVDARIAYELGALNNAWKGATLSVNASNLFDVTYVGQCASTSFCQYGLRRTVLGQINYRF